MRIVFTGSGSGGHFYPLMSIAEALATAAHRRKLLPPELYLMGPDPYDQEALFANRITYIRVPAGKVRRYVSLKNVTDAFRTLYGIAVALVRLLWLYPDVVMSKGSYTSVPVVIAAMLLRIPVIVHESDVHPGRANLLAARFARMILVSYEQTAASFASKKPKDGIVRTGIPVRSRLLRDIAGNPQTTLGLTPDTPLLLVLGGSQGAERINNLIVTALDELLPQYTILHQSGEAHALIVTETARALTKQKDHLNRYHARGFLDVDTLHAAFSAASLVISRAGSGSIYEIALSGKPSILIPIPEEISHDQRENAYAYARTGAAVVMEEENLTPHLLVTEINRIMGDHALRLKMAAAARAFAPRDAAEQIAALLISIGLEHER